MISKYPNAKNVFGIIIGTGVGGGVIIDGKTLYGSQGIGGEWGHTIVTDNQIKSNAYDIVFDKFWKWMVKNVDGDFGELIRVRAAKTMKNRVTPTQPHVDAPCGHWGMIYYCDNSDGPTTIYKERYGENPENVRPKQYIDPEKGKYVIFDGRMYHSGNAPRKHSSRTILNINYYGHTRILPS